MDLRGNMDSGRVAVEQREKAKVLSKTQGYAIGRIEAAVGLTGNPGLREVYRAVEQLVDERDRLKIDLRRCLRELADAREDLADLRADAGLVGTER